MVNKSVIFFVFLLLVLLLLVAFEVSFLLSGDTFKLKPVPKEACNTAGGEWKEFPNGCADRCSPARKDAPICTQVITDSCDCGAQQCWNGEECVAI